MLRPNAWQVVALVLTACAAVLAVSLGGASGDTLWHLRMPRVAAGFFVGSLLALSGMSMQVLLRNPLADPYVLGTSGGAAVGAITALLLGAAMWMGAACGALLASGLLLLLARRVLGLHGDDASAQMVLIGAMLAATLGAMSTLLLTLTPDEQLRGAVFWLVGDLSGASSSVPQLWVAGGTSGAFTLYLCLRAGDIDRLMLGSQAAWQLGVAVTRLRIELLVLSSLAVACAVALAGAIGFVGLVVPQFLRLLGVHGTAALAALSAIAGGLLLVLADTAARQVASPMELPVGAVMALLGAPFMAWFLSRGARG